MEHARIFLAIVLSFLVFLVWEFFFVDRDAVRQQAQTAVVEQKGSDTSTSPKV